jgi:hypothetical protein
LEGLVYDHFDDDSPLDVTDRLAWLRRQYTPIHKRNLFDIRHGFANPVTSADSSPSTERVLSQMPVRNPASLSSKAEGAAHSQKSDVVTTQYEAATMPAPQTALPNATPTEPAMGNQAYRSYPMVVSPEETGAKPSTTVSPPANAKTPIAAEKKPAPDASVAKSDSADKKMDANSDAADAETTTADVQPAAPVAPPDPFGRRYITQPYTQLASVYRAIGQDEQANDVLVARAERLGELAPAFSAQGLWYRYLGRLIGYGYEPFRAIKIGLVIIAVGAFVFAVGAHRNLMSETKLAERVLSNENESGVVSSTYPRFNAIVYSLDVFLPFVDLNQVCYWIPGEKLSKPRVSRNCFMHIGRYSVKWSSVLHGYLWFQTLAGWTLCTLLAAAVTGIVQS